MVLSSAQLRAQQNGMTRRWLHLIQIKAGNIPPASLESKHWNAAKDSPHAAGHPRYDDF
jgi:hypothetical protein